MKGIAIGLVIVAAIFIAIFVFRSGGQDFKSDLQIIEKELVASTFNKANIEGKVKNTGTKTINKVLIKAELFSEEGDMLDDPFVMIGPIRVGEEKGFEIKGFADYYKVTKFEVFIDSAQ